ncbi:hypothetical protein [Streptomyces cahuitamycinicus]|uniref:hypothetical protein n=1 Tax=Streptomyces cahuitamycinicus TaxID=2070367 RepID=UPI0034E08D3F
MAGATVAGVVLEWLAGRGRPWFPVGLVCEAVLLVCAGVLALARHGTGAVPAQDGHGGRDLQRRCVRHAAAGASGHGAGAARHRGGRAAPRDGGPGRTPRVRERVPGGP